MYTCSMQGGLIRFRRAPGAAAAVQRIGVKTAVAAVSIDLPWNPGVHPERRGDIREGRQGHRLADRLSAAGHPNIAGFIRQTVKFSAAANVTQAI